MNNNSNKELITEDVVRHVARLSRLSLDEEDVAKYQHQLSHILEYIAQLNEVDVEGVPPTSHVLSSLKNVFRKDELKRSLSPEEFMDNAPQRHEDLFKVPKVI